MDAQDHAASIAEELFQDDPYEPKGHPEPESKHAKGWMKSPRAAQRRRRHRQIENQTRKRNRGRR